MKFFSLTATTFLLLATTATASDRCVNYLACVQMEPAKWGPECRKSAFTSFNPRTRTTVVVASIDGTSNGVAWENGFGAVMYGGIFRLEWRVGAIPTPLPPDKRVGAYPNEAPSQSLGKVWNSYLWDASGPNRNLNSKLASLNFDAPAHRRIEAGDDSGDTYEAFGTPITWTNTETGEKKFLTQRPVPDGTYGTNHPLQISTADNFILVAERFSGGNAIVADMNSGEVLLRAGDDSQFTSWGKCPSQ